MKNQSFSSCFLTFCPGTHVCLGETHVCLGETHVCLGETHVCLGETHPGVISLFFPPCFFSNPFFFWVLLMFFQNPLFPPIDFFHPPRAPSKKNLHGISPSFFFGSCLCFFSFPFFLPKENVHPPRVSKNST